MDDLKPEDPKINGEEQETPQIVLSKVLPTIRFTPDMMYCKKHILVFWLKPQFYRAGAAFLLSLLKKPNDPYDIMKACGVKGTTDVDKILRMLPFQLLVKPMCCRIPQEMVVDSYKASGIGVMANCNQCSKFEMGTQYQSTNSFFKLGVRWDHICFPCAATKQVRYK